MTADSDLSRAHPLTVIARTVTALVQAFDAALATLSQTLAAALQLPDPSPPSGQGSAYDKFLAIYQAMRDGHYPGSDDQVPPHSIVSA